MASPQKTAPKSTSKWNFFTQAVASVESRLDTILADDEVPARKPTPQPLAPKENAQPPRASMESQRGTSSTNDRLQERLARAMAKKNHPRSDSPAVSEPASRASTPGVASPVITIADPEVRPETPIEHISEPHADATVQKENHPDQEAARLSLEKVPIAETHIRGTDSLRGSKDSPRISQEQPNLDAPDDEADTTLLQVQLEHEDVKTRLQDEIKGYIERIDALNAKLQFLTKEAAESAKRSAADSQPGSMEKVLHEKDEKIALLLEEGQKLSMSEMKHLTAIKKLRAQASTSNKDQDAIRQRAERAERNISALDERTKRAEAAAKTMELKLVESSKKAQDLEAVNREKAALNETLTEMRSQVAKANARAEAAESKVRSDQVEVEKRRIAELQDDLSSVKVERELAEEKLRQEIKDLKSALEREKEQTRAMETEMLAEQAALEGKLETFRVRAEEASANDRGDGQAKLLRQIETLQGQYAAASQNWQGIEGNLLSRITVLERQHDEISNREVDVRKKLKDASSRARNFEKELEDVQLEHATLQETQAEVQMETQRTNRRAQQLEEELARARKETEDLKARTERDFARRLEEEKSRWAASVQLARIDSPAASVRKGTSYDPNHLASPIMERPASRRSSTLASVLTNAEPYSPSRQHSATSFKHMYNGVALETPVLITSPEADEYFTGLSVTPGSPDAPLSRRGIGDLISTSTVGAGPSVQLVERMSANVRRLESEKAASKDELARITAQRDESRQEVVRLMREVEQTRKFENRMKELEEEHQVLSTRHQTTLEMLGEKSEQVEELKADILDVKQMYRELADHMK